MHSEHERSFGTIEVTGEGEAIARPDVAHVSLGVVTRGKVPGEAAAANAAIAGRVLAALQGLGIADDAIRTTGLSLEPIYEWDDANKRNVLVGYRAANQVQVSAGVDAIAAVYDAGISAGATEAGAITFGLRDEEPLRQQALKAATLRGIEEAHLVARVLGVQSRGPIEVQLLGGSAPQAVEFAGMRKAETPVMPGQLRIVERVRMVFQTRIVSG